MVELGKFGMIGNVAIPRPMRDIDEAGCLCPHLPPQPPPYPQAGPLGRDDHVHARKHTLMVPQPRKPARGQHGIGERQKGVLERGQRKVLPDNRVGCLFADHGAQFALDNLARHPGVALRPLAVDSERFHYARNMRGLMRGIVVEQEQNARAFRHGF